MDREVNKPRNQRTNLFEPVQIDEVPIRTEFKTKLGELVQRKARSFSSSQVFNFPSVVLKRTMSEHFALCKNISAFKENFKGYDYCMSHSIQYFIVRTSGSQLDINLDLVTCRVYLMNFIPRLEIL